MLKSCKYCGRVHDIRYDCGKKPVQKSKKPTDADRFRWTRAWKDKTVEIKRRDNYLCQVCLRKKYNTLQQYNFTGLEVHHVVPINQDWGKRLDNGNLITLCTMHHKMAEDGEIPADEILEIIAEQERKVPPGVIV